MSALVVDPVSQIGHDCGNRGWKERYPRHVLGVPEPPCVEVLRMDLNVPGAKWCNKKSLNIWFFLVAWSIFAFIAARGPASFMISHSSLVSVARRRASRAFAVSHVDAVQTGASGRAMRIAGVNLDKTSSGRCRSGPLHRWRTLRHASIIQCFLSSLESFHLDSVVEGFEVSEEIHETFLCNA